MSFSRLLHWRLWHLTPEGWVGGSLGFGEDETDAIERPPSAILTCRFATIEESLTSAYGRDRSMVTEWWRAESSEREIEKWLELFGDCPETFRSESC